MSRVRISPNSPDLEEADTLLSDLFKEVKKRERRLADGKKLGIAPEAVNSLLQTKVSFGNPRDRLIQLTEETFKNSGTELNDIYKQQMREQFDFYYMTLTVDLRPEQAARFLRLTCKLDFEPKGSGEPIIQSLFPTERWQSVISSGVGMDVGLNGNLDWNIGVDSSQLAKVLKLLPDELTANVANKDEFKALLAIPAYRYELNTSGEGNSTCYWRIQDQNLQNIGTAKFAIVFKVPKGTDSITLRGTAWAEPNMSWLTADLEDVVDVLSDSFQRLLRQGDAVASQIARGDAEEWVLTLPKVSATADDALVHFPSLASLRAAHSDLLKRHRESGSTPELLKEVEEFIYRGRVTGALLDTDEDRWASQSLLDYWSAILYRAGREPPDATLAEIDRTLAPELDDGRCPYLGLEAFREEKSNLFYGRQRLLEKLVNHLKENRLLAVVGSSGSGKSSVVLGGVLPKLKVGALSGSENWHYYSPMVPGVNPLENLARLTQPRDVNATEWLQQQVENFQKDPNHLTKLSNEFGDRPSVLVVDQFEEAFTLCRDDSVRQAFINNLIGLIQWPGVKHTVILTMRTDFESQVARVPVFKDLFEQAQVRVTALDASELREAIEKPAELVGLKFEEGLVEALLQDVLGEPAALPLLQFTLLKLWDNRKRNRVTWETYKGLGGGRQALARSADEFYEQLIPEEQVTVKRILLRMVRPTEGLEVTSNRIQRKTLYQAGEARDRVDRVLDKLIEARLVRLTEDNRSDDAQVEVAHEALVRNWPRLVEWLEDERVNLRRRWRLAAAAEDWQARGRDKSILLRGSLLAEAQRYEDLNALEVEFIQRSVEEEQKVLENQTLSEVLKRVEAHTHTYEDLKLLKQLLNEGDLQPISQQGRYIVNIGEGTTIQIGDRDYVEWNDKAIQALIGVLQILPSPRTTSSRWENQEVDIEQQKKLSFDNQLELIQTKIGAIEELHKANLLSENQDKKLTSLKKSFSRLEKELEEIALSAKKLIRESVESLELKLEKLSSSTKELLEPDSQVNEQNHRIISLQRQIEIVREFDSGLEFGREASIWLNNNRVLFSRTVGKYALDAYPEIKSVASPEQIDNFYFSIEQFLEQVSHCLTWGRYNILDSPSIPLIFNFHVYEIAFTFIKQLLPRHLPDESIEQLEDYLDYLIKRLPNYATEDYSNHNATDLGTILERIADCKQTDADIATLRQLLNAGDRQTALQLGKYNINIGEEKDIYIGERIYSKLDDEAIQGIIQAIQKRIQEDRQASQPTTIKLKTCEGNESASLRAAAHWLNGVKHDKTVTFLLPEGYVRYSFSENINRDGISSGGYVRWENDNPQDARIRLHAWADAPNGISNVSVSEVWGIRQDAL